MGSKGRQQPYLRQTPNMMNPNPFIPDIHPPNGPFFDMLPPPEIMEQKLITQHSEMQKLAHENHRLASSHVTLRQDLAATQQELQRMQAQIGLMKAEKEQKMKALQDKIMKMEPNLQASEGIKVELQQARAEAQNLLSVREELISRAQHLNQDLRRGHADIQQIPALMSELEGLRREYHDCRLTYEHERKLYSDHLESLQVMEKNYVSMLREVEKLRTELANSSSSDRRAGGHYGSNVGYQESEALASSAPSQTASAQLLVVQNAYEDVYNVHQGRTPPGGATSHGDTTGGASQPQMAGNYDATRGSSGGGSGGYDASRGSSAATTNYDTSKPTPYDASRPSAYDTAHRGAAAGYESAAMYTRPPAATATATAYRVAMAQGPGRAGGDRDQPRGGTWQ